MKTCKHCGKPCAPSAEANKFAQCTNCRKHAATDAKLIAAVQAGGLEPFANALGISYMDALLACGSVGGAAIKLGIEPRTLRADLDDIVRAAARRGISPSDDKAGTAPIGYHTKGKSILYGADGAVKLTWHKTQADKDQQIAELLDAIRLGLSDLPQSAPIKCSTKLPNEDLLAVYPMGDPHLGMLAWPAETGNAFDLAIAERNLFAAVDRLVDLAPRTQEALIANLGDFFHADNKNSTTTKGTRLDTDGRWPKVLATGIKLMRRIIDRALQKHERVTVINEIGNHDDHTSIVLSIALAQFYEHEPRVHIDTSPQSFHWYRFGKVLIGTHHGHNVKATDLPGVMAVDQAVAWGETTYRYWYVGHVHHDSLKELPGCTVETFRTLAGKDAWHAGQGYRAGRDMKLIVLHKEHGEVGRHTVGISLVHELIEQED